MAWREALLTKLGTSVLAGSTLGRWLRVLWENDFAVDPPYWGRAASITLNSLPNSLIAAWETLLYHRKINATIIDPPLFILERINARLLGFLIPKQRPMDNVAFGFAEPQEDEFALAALIGGFSLGWAFPRRAGFYDRFLTLRDASAKELAEWKAALTWFLQKVTFKHGNPLILKSPGHTCRIKVLLELSPEAKFVHIRRNPFDVFKSTEHLIRTGVTPVWTLQRPDHRDLDDRILRQYKEVYDAYFEERGLIPKGHFHEISFEELEADPIRQVRGIYEALALPDFQVVEPVLKRYVESLAGYKKNSFSEIPSELRTRIAQAWRRCFEEWGYPV